MKTVLLNVASSRINMECNLKSDLDACVMRFCENLAHRFGLNKLNFYAIYALGEFCDDIIVVDGDMFVRDKVTGQVYAKLVDWVPEPV